MAEKDEVMKKIAKESIKKVGQQIWSVIAPALPWIILVSVIVLIIAAFIKWDDVGLTASADGVVGDGSGGMSLTTTMFDKSTFKEALQAYYEKTNNQDFYNNFLSRVDTLYDESVRNDVNPELVVVTALWEGSFKETRGLSNNYWRIRL